MRRTRQRLRLILTTTMIPALAIALVAGCSDQRDQRLAEMAERNVAEQARQNERLAQHSQQVIEATQQLVASDAQARQQMIEAHAALQQEIHNSQANVERQRDELEQERRDLAQQRGRDPIVAESLAMLALTLACVLPLVLAGYVLYTVNRAKPDDAALGELLITELVAEEPLLLLPAARSAPRLENHRISEPGEAMPSD